MAKKNKWAKICNHNKGESCYNCINRLCITDEKLDIVVICDSKWEKRTIKFNRKFHPVPYCGMYESSIKD